MRGTQYVWGLSVCGDSSRIRYLRIGGPMGNEDPTRPSVMGSALASQCAVCRPTGECQMEDCGDRERASRAKRN